MQLSVAAVLFAAIIGLVTSSPSAPSQRIMNVPILSRLSLSPAPSSSSVSEYRTSSQLFRLPARQQQQPDGLLYGPVETPEELTTTTEMPTTTEPAEELKLKEAVKVGPLAEKFDQEGVYYIYHPDGLLQRVVYGTRSEDMGYTARLTYKDVEPIKQPIYTYDPQTLVFSRIEV